MNTIKTSKEKQILTVDDLSKYLMVSYEDIEDIIEKDDLERASRSEGIYDTYILLPYMEIAGEKRFLKKEIDKWLEYQSNNH